MPECTIVIHMVCGFVTGLSSIFTKISTTVFFVVGLGSSLFYP